MTSRGFLHPGRGRERTATLAPQKRKGGEMSGPGQVKRPNTSNPLGRLCRLCAKGDFAVFNLEKKPETVVKVRELLNIQLDLGADRKAGYPAFVCIQCCNNLQILAAFKGNVARAQMELEQKFSREVEVINDLSPER